jgi:hypothetical protein
MSITYNELKQRWPLFEFEHHIYKEYGEQWTIQFDPNKGANSPRMNIPDTSFDNINHIERIDQDHTNLRLKRELEVKYPNLYFYIGNSNKPEAIWINRNGTGHEAMTTRDFDPDTLANLNELAGQAMQPDWFWCSGCNEPTPKSEYSYFYFAGSYCRKWKEEHPSHFKDAMNENYN